MNAPSHAPPRKPLPLGTLDERIALAEQRLVANEQNLQHRARALLQRAQTVTEPRRMIRPALYALGTLALAWGAMRLLQGRRGTQGPDATASPRAVTAAPAASRWGEVPWVRASALLWPLLPVAWRGRIGADTASIVVAVGLPLAGWLFRKRQRAPLRREPTV